MRKLVFLLAPATLALLAVMACETDSSSGGPQLGFDASLADFAAPPATGIDAPPPDKDADVVPAVTVTVTSSRGPKAGVTVVFHDATGAVIETKSTGADGKVAHTGTPPSMVSALLAVGSTRHIVTWTGAEVGDALVVRDTDTSEQIGLYSVTFADFPETGAETYRVLSPCGSSESNGTATELPLYQGCTRAQNAVLAAAHSGAGQITSHSFKKGNPNVTDGGTGAISLTGWNAPSSFTSTVSNLPGETFVDSRLLEIADGSGFWNDSGSTDGSSTSFTTATGFADALQASTQFESNGSVRSITKRLAPAPSVAFDFATLLPPVTGAEIDTTDPRRPIVHWTSESAVVADGGLVHFNFSRSDEVSGDWTFVVPSGATSIKAPSMPAEAADFLPAAADSGLESYIAQPEIAFIEADAIPNYTFFRNQQGAILGLWEGYGGFTLPALAADGTYRLTGWVEPNR